MPMQTVPSRLLFLPGALGNCDFWQPIAHQLDIQAEKMLMAYPGFGGILADPSVPSFEDLLDRVVSRIDRPTAVIAQSMGGVLAIEATLRRRDLITHLVLVATSGGLNTIELGVPDWREEFRRDHPALPDWFTSYQSDLTSRLSGIDIPVLLIWGDRDSISPVVVGEMLLNHLPNAELHIISDGRHDLAHAHPQKVAPLIDAQLRKRTLTGTQLREVV